MVLRDNQLVFSPSDLIVYMSSPFASWMDHYHAVNPGILTPDEDPAERKMVASKGLEHEARMLSVLRTRYPGTVEIPTGDRDHAFGLTLDALQSGAPMIYQAYLRHDRFAGWSDFIIRTPDGRYQVWDTKLARKPKPYYAIQLCCYTEMLHSLIGVDKTSDYFGVILGTEKEVEFRTADYFDYYRTLKSDFLALHDGFVNDYGERPDPAPRADHGRWNSYAKTYFQQVDHLVQVAGMAVGNMKKLQDAGITTVEELANAGNAVVPRMATDTLRKLVHQAHLQVRTRNARQQNEHALPEYDVLPSDPSRNITSGLTRLPVSDPADVYFDLEGYPLIVGGLEYLWGVCYHDRPDELTFRDWWAHDSQQERAAFESFIDWVYSRWKAAPCMHIYHYASYELNVVRRLSTRYSTRQEEVDDLLKNNVFVDLYKVVTQSIRLGEDSYSIKRVERLYRDKRSTEVATAGESIVQYARYLEQHGAERPTWHDCEILKGIRDYNEDDCVSTYELVVWLRNLASNHGIALQTCGQTSEEQTLSEKAEANRIAVEQRQGVEDALRTMNTPIAATLADIVDFHRREDKPMWWAFYDRQTAEFSDLWLDHACIAGVEKSGDPIVEKQSLVQEYIFDPTQECKLSPDGKTKVMFSHATQAKCSIVNLDTVNGRISLKLGKKSIEKYDGAVFPSYGSLIPDEFVSAEHIQAALKDVCESYLLGELPSTALAILTRRPPAGLPQRDGEAGSDAALRIARGMNGDCLIIQGPPGTGKTYTAGRVISALLNDGKRVGIASNGHKAIMNLLRECGQSTQLRGCKVGGDGTDPLFDEHPHLQYINSTGDAIDAFDGGVVAGTAWLFAREEWREQLDYLFIDEAGQVSLANALAMSRCARNIVLMGDQMQLEQPIKGAHPGDAALSVLQYYLKDTERSAQDIPVFHAVVAPESGLFLGVSRRMHPDICTVVSDIAYEGRLAAHSDCAAQRVMLSAHADTDVDKETGIVFINVEHDGNIQHSPEEVNAIVQLTTGLLGRTLVAKDGSQRGITLDDILFIAPYNAQVRALRDALPEGARVGSVDKFQGLEAPICVLSMCSSYGEYGARGLQFILDTNRVNVAISRAQCLAIVVGDGRIGATSVHTLDEMKLLNAFCRIKNNVLRNP